MQFKLIIFLLLLTPCGLIAFNVVDDTVKISTAITSTSEEALTLSGYGTGFFWGINNHVVTAYHVIYGATKIEVVFNKKVYSDITIVSVSPKYDIAILRVNGLIEQSEPTPIINSLPSDALTGDISLSIHGYVFDENTPLSYRARLMATTPQSTFIFRDEDGMRIFRIDIECYVVEGLMYGGLSGGPLVWENNILGFVTGSQNISSSRIWVIPIKFIHEEQVVINGSCDDLDEWPEMELYRIDKYRNYAFDQTPIEENLHRVNVIVNDSERSEDSAWILPGNSLLPTVNPSTKFALNFASIAGISSGTVGVVVAIVSDAALSNATSTIIADDLVSVRGIATYVAIGGIICWLTAVVSPGWINALHRHFVLEKR